MFFSRPPKVELESTLQFLDITIRKTLDQVWKEVEKKGDTGIRFVRLPGYLAGLEARGLVKGFREGLNVSWKLTQVGFGKKREMFPEA